MLGRTSPRRPLMPLRIQGVSTRASVLPVYVDYLRIQGRFSEALMHLSEALAAAALPRCHALWCPFFSRRHGVVDLFRLGRAQEYVDELMVSLRPGESLHLRLEAMLLWGRILVASGEYHHAEGLLQDTAQRAESAGLCVIEGHANALLGQVDCFLGRIDQGDARMANSVDVLVQRGRHSAALDASLVWARARGVTLNPDAIFEPVSALLERSSLWFRALNG